MRQLILDPTILDQLLAMKETVALCYPDGRVVGNFVPLPCPESPGWKRPAIADEELAARKREGGRPLAQILADLEKRA